MELLIAAMFLLVVASMLWAIRTQRRQYWRWQGLIVGLAVLAMGLAALAEVS